MRKTFTTTIEESLQASFKGVCTEKNIKMNEVLEAFMDSFIKGEFEVETEVKHKLKHKSK